MAEGGEPENLADIIKGLASLISNQKAPIVNVNVAHHKIGTFTGLKPKGGNEIDYITWKEQVNSYVNNSTDDDGVKFQKVSNSLKGVSKQQIQDCEDITEIIDTFDGIYDPPKSNEDIFSEFLNISRKSQETPSDYLLRLWNFLAKANIDPRIICLKVYYTFMKDMKSSFPLLELEIRAIFGEPGTDSPDLTRVLSKVKHLETSNKTIRCNVQTTMENIDYDLLAEKVAEKLKASTIVTSNSGPNQKEKLCYYCNQRGHISRFCQLRLNENRSSRGRGYWRPI